MRTIVNLEDTDHYFRPPYAKFKLGMAFADGTPTFKVFAKKDGVSMEVALRSSKEAPLHIKYTTLHEDDLQETRG